MTDNLLGQLNDSQRAAVEYCDGAALVIAGAGSGKTRVLTYKIAYLLQQGMMPWNILALTFTNKAAREMKERIGSLVGGDLARRLNMGTFHSVFSRILRAEAECIGFSHNFTIYDQNDSRSLVKSIIKEMGLDEKSYKASSVADRISMAKNRLLLPAAYASSAVTVREDTERRMPMVKDIYIRYAERCRQANAMDFDDLLVNTYVLFDRHEDVRLKYSGRFEYVLVDEYQDTNYAQQAIVMQLTKERQKICVVGDDAQSIYSFRGANIDNILSFTDVFDNAKLFKLEQNYRSTQLIVQAANSLIKHNARQIPKDTFSENEHGEKLVLKPAYSDKEEALIVCNDIKRIKTLDKYEYSDFAILYRTNSQSRSFEECMRKMDIPYRIYGGLSFYQRKEIKDLIAYFRVVVNPDDEEALRRIINYPTRGIGDTTVNKIIGVANENRLSLWTVMSNPVVYGLEVNKGTLKKLEAFRDMIAEWTGRVMTEDAFSLGDEIILRSGLMKEIYGGREPDDLARQENLEEFRSAMKDFVESRREEGLENDVSLNDYLQEVSLLTDLDSDDDDSHKVTLMTVHSAKGLEFSNVFIVGLEENIFPSPLSCNSMRELEEERRLLYVAVTRAEKRCILTCAQNRFRYGRMEYDTPSRFIKDFDPALIRVESSRSSDLFGSEHRRRERIFNGGQTQYDEEKMRNLEKGILGDNRLVTSWKKRSSAPWENSQSNPFVDNYRVGDRIERNSKENSVKSIPTATLKPVSSLADIGINGRQDIVSGTSLKSKTSSFGIREDSVIEHQRFGVGKILKIEGTGENMKATVQFVNAGTKQLLLKFARYTVTKF